MPVCGEIAEPVGPDDPFGDMSKTAWYHHAVQWAIDRGLMHVVSDMAFSPMSR